MGWFKSFKKLLFSQERSTEENSRPDPILGTEVIQSSAASGEKADCAPLDMRTEDSYGVRYLEHNIPDRLPAKSVIGCKLTLENTGRMIWRPFPANGNSVDLAVRYNSEVVATHKIPRLEVHPGEKVTIHFMLKAPDDPGDVTAFFELVEQNVSVFTNQGVEPLAIKMTVTPGQNDPNDETFDQAFKYNPWHYQPTRGISKSRDGTSFPVFITRSKGCKIWDLSGREYIDYVMGWGSTLLGYADDRIQNAIKKIIDLTAPVVPYPHPVEMEVAQMLCEDIPCAEMVIFGKNGSDACTVAARTARAFTGKKKILFAGYHEWQDFWVEQLGFENTGIPERPELLIHRYKFNDEADFFRLYDEFKDDLAAVMIEPSGPWEGDDVGWGGDADPKFLQTIADAARDANALLVFDEIVTGYRYPGGSVQKATGVTPDMTCLGKALASGMPLSALVSKKHIFQQALPRTNYGPTFKWEIYSLAAAKAAIKVYREEPVAQYVWDYGTRLKKGVNEICSTLGVSGKYIGPPFRMALMFDDKDLVRLKMKKTLYQQEMLRRGLSTYNGVMLPSYSHDDEVLKQTLTIINESLEVVVKAEKENDFDKYLEIPPLIDL